MKGIVGCTFSTGYSRSDWEAKRPHMEALRERHAAAKVDPSRLLGHLLEARPALVPYKARRKVLQTMVPDPYKTADMVATPRHRLGAIAMRGLWKRFPVDPGLFEPVFATEIHRRKIHVDATLFGLARRMEDRLVRAVRESGRDPGQLPALYRAGLPVLIEGVGYLHDRGGVLAALYRKAVLAPYFEVARAGSGLPPETYYRDFLNLAIWEDSGFLHEELGPFFRAIPPEHVARADAILRPLRRELQGHEELDYPAEAALTLLGALRAEKEDFDRFVDLAREMGSRHWHRAELLGRTAWRAGESDLARELFRAADQPGEHRDYLRKACGQITGSSPPGP